MSRKNEIAQVVADQSTEWFRSKIRQAYMQGWDDAEKNMYEKAEALLEVVRATKEGE